MSSARVRPRVLLQVALILGSGMSSQGQAIQSSPARPAGISLKDAAGGDFPLMGSCGPAPCVLPAFSTSQGQADTPAIATNPRNGLQLLVVAKEYPAADCIGAYASNDAGTTWNSTCIQTFEPGDPVVAYGERAAYISYADSALGGPTHIVSSTDGGLSWGTPEDVTGPILDGTTNIASVQTDNSPDSPYSNAVYVSVTQFDAEVVESEISVSHSNDNGSTWTTTTVDPVQYKPLVDQFSRLALGSDGTVYVAWQRCAMTGQNINCAGTTAEMLLSKSTDGGNTWSAPVTIANVKLVPDTCDCSFFGNLPHTNEPVANMPVIGIDDSNGPHAGSLYAVFYNWTGTQMKVEVATSTDGGNTWSKPLAVAGSARHDEFFPTLSVSPSGLVGVSWLDRRNDPMNVDYQPFGAISTNGGAAFSKNYAVTSTLSDPYLDGNGGTYMGDYTGNAWDGNNFFLVTWPDSRNMQFMEDYIGGFRIR